MEFDIQRYTPEWAERWNQFVARSKNATFLFDRRYMDYHQDRFSDSSLLFIRDGEPYALLPANRVGATLYSHQGLSYGGLIMSEQCTTKKVCHLFTELCDYLHADGINKVVYKAVPWIFHQLPSEEDLFAISLCCKARLVGREVSSTLMPSKPVVWKRDRRYAAGKAERNGISISRNEQEYAAFWDVLSDNLLRTHGATPVHTLQEMELLHSRFPEQIQLWVAHDENGQLLAGTVLYVSSEVVHSQYISATPEGKHLHAVDALYHHIISNAFSEAHFIDLGTSNMPHNNELHESLIYQKEGFGARAVCYDTYEWEITAK